MQGPGLVSRTASRGAAEARLQDRSRDAPGRLDRPRGVAGRRCRPAEVLAEEPHRCRGRTARRGPEQKTVRQPGAAPFGHGRLYRAPLGGASPVEGAAQIQPRRPGQGREEGPRCPDAPVLRSLPGFRSGGAGACRRDGRADPFPALRAVPVCPAGTCLAKAAAQPPVLRRFAGRSPQGARLRGGRSPLGGHPEKIPGGPHRRVPGYGPRAVRHFRVRLRAGGDDAVSDRRPETGHLQLPGGRSFRLHPGRLLPWRGATRWPRTGARSRG